MVDGSTQGSWSEANPGATVTITCLDDHVLVGNSDLRCGVDGTWSNGIPTCVLIEDSKIGESRCD